MKYYPCIQNICFFQRKITEEIPLQQRAARKSRLSRTSSLLALCNHCQPTPLDVYCGPHSVVEVVKKTLPKAQQTQGLNASTKVTTFKSYYKLIKKHYQPTPLGVHCGRGCYLKSLLQHFLAKALLGQVGNMSFSYNFARCSPFFVAKLQLPLVSENSNSFAPFNTCLCNFNRDSQF